MEPACRHARIVVACFARRVAIWLGFVPQGLCGFGFESASVQKFDGVQ